MTFDSLSGVAGSGNNLQPAGKTDDATQINDRFLKLLVAQMKNQDPMNPTDNSKITSQMAQINTVSGINQLDKTLQGINGQIDKSQQIQAAALTGKDVLVPGDEVKVGDDGTAMPFGYRLAGPAQTVKITLSDDSGAVVHQSEYENQSAGIQSLAWDGINGDAPVDPGRYTLNVEAVDAEGQAVRTQTLATGRVGGVVMADEGPPQLDLGPAGLVSLDDVLQVL